MQVSYYPAPPPPGPPAADPGRIPQQQGPSLALDHRLVSAADLELPNFARAVDCLLGGSANFAVDRAIVADLRLRDPLLDTRMRANRAFAHRFVRWAVARGVDQFLDLGSGIPSIAAIHDVVRVTASRGRTAYVDLDPVTVAHARAIVEGRPDVAVTWGDLRAPDALLASAELRGFLDPTRPVAAIVCGSLQFVHDDLAEVVERYRRVLAPGSLLAVTHPVLSEESPWYFDGLFSRGLAGLAVRTRKELRAGFDAVDPDGPGVVDVIDWPRPAAGGRRASRILGAAGALARS